MDGYKADNIMIVVDVEEKGVLDRTSWRLKIHPGSTEQDKPKEVWRHILIGIGWGECVCVCV